MEESRAKKMRLGPAEARQKPPARESRDAAAAHEEQQPPKRHSSDGMDVDPRVDRKRAALKQAAPSLEAYLQSGGYLIYRPRSEWFDAPAALSMLASSEALQPQNPSSSATASAPPHENRNGQSGGGGSSSSSEGEPSDGENADANADASSTAAAVASGDLPRLAVHQVDLDLSVQNGAQHHNLDRLPRLPSSQLQSLSAAAAAAALTSATVLPPTTAAAGRPIQPSFPARFGKDDDTAIHVAIRKKATDAAIALLEHGMDPNIRNRKLVTPLILASQEGNTRLVRWLLASSASSMTSAAGSPFHPNHPRTRLRPVDVGATTYAGATAVLQAAHFGHLGILKMLLEDATNTFLSAPSSASSVSTDNSHGSDGNAVLHFRQRPHGHHTQHRGTLMEVANLSGTTPLMRASQEGHIETVKYLLQRGALPNRRNHASMTALMLAAQRDHGDVCQVLIDYGAEVDALSPTQSTPLILASKRGQLSAVQVLVGSGAELFQQSDQGKTPLQVAIKHERWHLVPFLNPQMQVYLMRNRVRKKVIWEIVRMYHLYQANRVSQDNNLYYWRYNHHRRPQLNTDEHEQNRPQPVVPRDAGRNLPHVSQNIAAGHASAHHSLLFSAPSSWHSLMTRIMHLPSSLVELICQFAPLPHVWDVLIGLYTRRALKNPNSAVLLGLDLIDEILEEGGICDACDMAGLPPPLSNFRNWAEWHRWARGHASMVPSASFSIGEEPPARPVPAIAAAEAAEQRNDNVILPRAFIAAADAHRRQQQAEVAGGDDENDGDDNDDDDNQRQVEQRQHHQRQMRQRTTITRATIPKPQNPLKPTIQELRHQARYLDCIASSPRLQEILRNQPYRIPPAIVQQLSTIADIQSLFRRMVLQRMNYHVIPLNAGANMNIQPNVHVDSPVAVDLIMLCSRLLSWYSREREHA